MSKGTTESRIEAGIYDNLIRSNWVNIASDELKANLKDLPQSLRFETYKSIDAMVKDKQLELLLKRKEAMIETDMTKTYNTHTGQYQYEEEINIEEMIQQAAEETIKEMTQ